MSELIKSLDVAIGRYYKSKGNNEYFDKDGNGKFYNFCQANGFDHNSIKDEIESTPDECMLVEFDDNMPGAVTQIDRYNAIKRCYNECINFQSQNDDEKTVARALQISEMKTDTDSETDEDDEFVQECLINPSNDRRTPISCSPDLDINIIDCIGSLIMIHSNLKNNKIPEKLVGTATVIAVKGAECYLLTCAHNVRTILRHCKNCNLDTLMMKCKQCGGKTKKVKPVKLLEPGEIRFERRDHTTGKLIRYYKINKINIPYQYKIFSRACQGYDICVLRFECTNKNDLKLFEEKCKNIKLVTDISLGNQKDVIRIYGFPGYILKKRNYIMYGMSTS
eukprot:349122_1